MQPSECSQVNAVIWNQASECNQVNTTNKYKQLYVQFKLPIDFNQVNATKRM